MKRLRWMAQRAADRLGWSGVAGTVLLMLCAAFYGVALAPLERQRHALQSTTVAEARSSAALKRAEEVPQAQLAAFRRYFAGEETLETHLAAIYEAAAAARVNLKRGEYRLLEEKTWGLRQYQIVLPVTDTYPRVRQFVSRVLAAAPVASLDAIYFQRKRIGDAVVEAEIRFTVFVAEKT